MTKPLLNPPCTGWREDLPLPHGVPVSEALLGGKTPNHLSPTYLELPRTTISPRGIMSAFISPISPILLLNAHSAIFEFNALGPEFMLLNIFELGLIAWIITFGIRNDIDPPRDSPIRFNRARQKIYAYKFNYRWWNPFGKWGVAPVSHNWSQVRAEHWSHTGAVSGASSSNGA